MPLEHLHTFHIQFILFFFSSLTSPLPISPPWVTRRTRVPPFRKPEPDSWRLTKASSAKEDTARAAVGVAEGENAAEPIYVQALNCNGVMKWRKLHVISKANIPQE